MTEVEEGAWLRSAVSDRGRFLGCGLEMTLCDNRGSVERLTHEMSGV